MDDITDREVIEGTNQMFDLATECAYDCYQQLESATDDTQSQLASQLTDRAREAVGVSDSVRSQIDRDLSSIEEDAAEKATSVEHELAGQTADQSELINAQGFGPRGSLAGQLPDSDSSAPGFRPTLGVGSQPPTGSSYPVVSPSEITLTDSGQPIVKRVGDRPAWMFEPDEGFYQFTNPDLGLVKTKGDSVIRRRYNPIWVYAIDQSELPVNSDGEVGFILDGTPGIFRKTELGPVSQPPFLPDGPGETVDPAAPTTSPPGGVRPGPTITLPGGGDTGTPPPPPTTPAPAPPPEPPKPPRSPDQGLPQAPPEVRKPDSSIACPQCGCPVAVENVVNVQPTPVQVSPGSGSVIAAPGSPGPVTPENQLLVQGLYKDSPWWPKAVSYWGPKAEEFFKADTVEGQLQVLSAQMVDFSVDKSVPEHEEEGGNGSQFS